MTRPETPSAGPPSLSEERLAELMVKVVDEVASPAEREELMSYLVSHPEERAELDAQRAIRAVTRGWGARLEADLRARQASSWQLTAQRVGLALLIGGVALLLGFGLVEATLDAEVPWPLRLGLGALISGLVLTMGGLAAQRLNHHDPYDDVHL
ncbi:MAG: hypothetical protein IPO67_27120 [Deltaproteobacteria bacterium]|nr:hypothetical protein [Deltaproteobacteria bacterium]MBK9648779.1 hypothetical protein [Deltaproteobacteria bacterium]